MRRIPRILVLAVLLLAAAALAGVAQPPPARTAVPALSPRTLTVAGSGSTTAAPDRATLGFGVETRAATATAALAGSARGATAVIAALKSAGAAAADIRTSQVSLSTVTNPDGTAIVGYTASNGITAAAPVGEAGALIDAAVGAGATSVSGPGLSVSQRDALYRDALGRAVADAKRKAQALATAAGLTLGAVESVVEGSSPSPLPLSVRAVPSSGAVPIEPGTQEIDATVTVTFAVS